MRAIKGQPAKKKRARARRKPHAPVGPAASGQPVYGPAWGRWIMSNVERDLRSGALRVNAEGATLH